jgi:catechol 2,3-dioxygenase
MIAEEVLDRPVHIGPRRMCHANLFVSDVEASIDFYTRICGLDLASREPPIKAAFFSNGNSHHDLGMLETTRGTVKGEGGHGILSSGAAENTGLYHLGWEMHNEFELVKAYRRSLASNFKINRTSCHRSSNSMYVSDAAGLIHEFYADVVLDWRTCGPPKSGQWDPMARAPLMEARYQQAPEILVVPGAPLHPVRFSHAVLVVKDLARERRFFSNVVGLYELPHSRSDTFAAFATPEARYPFTLALLDEATGASANRGLHHYSLEIASEAALEEARQKLEAQGRRPERVVDLPHKRSLFLRDPDGIAVEFVCLRKSAIDFDVLPANAGMGFLL